jgi:hypothetical protein
MVNAIDLCEYTGRWVIAHSNYYSLTEHYTDDLLQKDPAKEDFYSAEYNSNWKMMSQSVAGVLVMPREAYETVRGYDERFLGWGYEDNAFQLDLDKFWGKHDRTAGSVYHLWHDPGLNFDDPNVPNNRQLFREHEKSLKVRDRG